MMPIFRPHSSANVERAEFSKKLVNLLRDHNMNQADLARKSGLTRDAISTYVRARSMPEPKNLAKLAAAFNVAPSYFQLPVNRVADLMIAPPTHPINVFDTTAKSVFNMHITPEGEGRVEIRANLSAADAAELMAFCAKYQKNSGLQAARV